MHIRVHPAHQEGQARTKQGPQSIVSGSLEFQTQDPVGSHVTTTTVKTASIHSLSLTLDIHAYIDLSKNIQSR